MVIFSKGISVGSQSSIVQEFNFLETWLNRVITLVEV